MKHKKVLIIEDTNAISKALTTMLSDEDIKVESVTTGEDALKTIKKGKFGVILLDLVLPDVDGFSILEKIKAKKQKPKVIILSNLSQEEDVKKAKDIGVEKYLIKSDTPLSEVSKYIKDCLKK